MMLLIRIRSGRVRIALSMPWKELDNDNQTEAARPDLGLHQAQLDIARSDEQHRLLSLRPLEIPRGMEIRQRLEDTPAFLVPRITAGLHDGADGVDVFQHAVDRGFAEIPSRDDVIFKMMRNQSDRGKAETGRRSLDAMDVAQ